MTLAVQILLEVVGGLGIFLLGMKNMSEGVQGMAGPGLRRMVNLAASNRFVACGVGTMVTCFVQSSSITTVMVIGLVNVGVMNLVQAIGVIMGANIGTTITGWVLVLKIGKYGLPILGVAALIFLFSKRQRLRYIAMGIMGLGMIFFGLELMKDGFKPLRDMPDFIAWFSAFSPHTYFGLLKCCLVGAILTAVVQSSSATLGITIGLAATGVIEFDTAAALVLGENIGTTITALLASLGGSVNARRASYAHILFNVTGVIWITAVFPVYLILVREVVATVYGGDPSLMVLKDGVETFPYVTAGIAATHTGFNVVNVLLFLPLIGFLARGLQALVPDAVSGRTGRLAYFDLGLIDTPALGIEQSRNEIVGMGVDVRRMLDGLRGRLLQGDEDEEVERGLFQKEEMLDTMQKEINEFLSHLLSGNVPHEVMEQSRGQLRMADEYESISDYIVNVLKLSIKLRKDGLEVEEAQRKEILDLHDRVAAYVETINDGVRNNGADIISAAITQSDSITHLMKTYRSNHLERVGTQHASPFESLVITDMLNAYRRIKDHALNIAEVMGGEK